MADITPQHAGKSILEIIWEELDSVYDQLMSEGRPRVPKQWGAQHPQEIADKQMKYGELRGQAQGLAYAIAVIQNPYDVSVPAVRHEAQRRYDDANED